MIQPLLKMVCRFLKKLEIKPPYDPAIPLLGIYPEETKILKDTCIPLFIAALFTIARTWKHAPPRHSHGDPTSLAPHERLTDLAVVPREKPHPGPPLENHPETPPSSRR